MNYVSRMTQYVQTIFQTIFQTIGKTIVHSEIVQSVVHSEDMFRMLVYVTQQTQQLPSQLDIRMNQLMDYHERRFNSLEEHMRLISIAIDRLTQDVETNNRTMINIMDKIAASVNDVSQKIQKAPDIVSLDKIVCRMMRESIRISTILTECHTHTKYIRDGLNDVRRSRVIDASDR